MSATEDDMLSTTSLIRCAAPCSRAAAYVPRVSPDASPGSLHHTSVLWRISILAAPRVGVPTFPSSSSFLTCSAFLPVSGVKNNVYDACFDETFIVFVHGANVELAQHETNDEKVC